MVSKIASLLPRGLGTRPYLTLTTPAYPNYMYVSIYLVSCGCKGMAVKTSLIHLQQQYIYLHVHGTVLEQEATNS